MTGMKKSAYRLEDQVGHLLRRANQRHAAIFFDGLGQKLTPMQFAVLIKIGDEGEVSQNLLGRLAAMVNDMRIPRDSHLKLSKWVSIRHWRHPRPPERVMRLAYTLIGFVDLHWRPLPHQNCRSIGA